MSNLPQFPLYIPSKGRSDYMMTSKALTEMGVKHFVVVEPNEYKEYVNKSKNLLCKIIKLDMSYKKKYDLCDKLGLSKSTGPGPARNFIWEHSIQNKSSWHWVMDDNIKNFCRLHRNERIKTNSPAMWKAMEDFVLRYKNVAMAGPNYTMFAFGASKIPPFITNTRIYSCNLIRNDVKFRWRGRYNEDTILSLDMLKAGWCTIQFNAFLQGKINTQTIKGGNSDEFYFKEGTIAKSKMQVAVHPDVSKIVYKFGRVHHHVDYNRFKKQKLIKKDGLKINPATNNYGMVKKEVKNK